MNDKNKGLYNKYEVIKVDNPSKVIDAIVLEFDDPIARVGIVGWAEELLFKGYEACGCQVMAKAHNYDKNEKEYHYTNSRTLSVFWEKKELQEENKKLKEENEKFKEFIDEIAESADDFYWSEKARRIRHGL